MSHESDEVKTILVALKHAMNRTATDYTGQHIAMCLYGLQNMKTTRDSDDVEALLSQINERLYKSTHNFSISNIASAMFGLKVIHSSTVQILFFLLNAFLSANEHAIHCCSTNCETSRKKTSKHSSCRRLF